MTCIHFFMKAILHDMHPFFQPEFIFSTWRTTHWTYLQKINVNSYIHIKHVTESIFKEWQNTRKIRLNTYKLRLNTYKLTEYKCDQTEYIWSDWILTRRDWIYMSWLNINKIRLNTNKMRLNIYRLPEYK